MDFFQRQQAQWNEIRLEEEVLRRIAGEGEFRGENNIRPGILKALAGIDDAAGVAFEIAHGGVDLCESDLHATFSRLTRNHELNSLHGIRLPEPPLFRRYNVKAQPKVGECVRNDAGGEVLGAHSEGVVGNSAEECRRPVGRVMHQHETHCHY
jgi:hypothetical protein